MAVPASRWTRGWSGRIVVSVEDPRSDQAVPGVHLVAEGRPGRLLFALAVDGEQFVVRRAHDGGTHYDWVSGPNAGYGFASSASPDQPEPQHKADVRAFLAMIDPSTGYVGDD